MTLPDQQAQIRLINLLFMLKCWKTLIPTLSSLWNFTYFTRDAKGDKPNILPASIKKAYLYETFDAMAQNALFLISREERRSRLYREVLE